jgi:DNA-binding transcriptional ArsR family regulator
MTLFQDRDLAARVAEKLKVFAQPQRLMILSCLLHNERNVADIGAVTGIEQPALSQQLAALRRAEIVRTRKEAKHVWYSLADAGVISCVISMEANFIEQDLRQDPTPLAQTMPAKKVPVGVAAFARTF